MSLGETPVAENWISDRVLKLTCTAEDMLPLAEAAGFADGIHKWNPSERAELLAELDAAYFLLYGLDRDDAAYILTTFRGIEDVGDLLPGVESQTKLIMNAYDHLASKSKS